MDESATNNAFTTKKQYTLPIQKRSSDLITAKEVKKRRDVIKSELAENDKKQELIDNTFVYFEKCPVRYIETRDVNGNEVKGYKDKEKVSPEEHFNVLNKLTATQDILLHENIVNNAVLAQPATQRIASRINTVNQVLADYEPKDSLETKLCLQAHTLYTLGMQYLSRAENSNMIPQSEFYMKNAMKLLRLHNETIETLNRHRRGGTHKVIVQHVQVNEGGKAVVGGLFEGGGK